MNPGPMNELNVVYHNVEGFVNLRDKSPSPQLFTSKVNDFHGHIFHEKPDIVILNETWLKSPILDSEIFPNNNYKVFRRDRSNISHPLDNKYPNKYKQQGGGVVIAFRSDLDIETTEFKLGRSPAKAEILSVVLKSRSGTGVLKTLVSERIVQALKLDFLTARRAEFFPAHLKTFLPFQRKRK